MSKRRLSVQQRRRIAQQRQEKALLKQAAMPLPDDSTLGDLRAGHVVTNFGRQAEIESDDLRQRCHIRANIELATGDRVKWRPGQELGVVESCEDRDTELQRPDIYGKLRCVAANVSQVLITIAPEPEPHTTLIDRYLIAARLHNLQACIVVNKADLASDNRDKLQEIERIYGLLGYSMIAVSSKTELGLDKLKQHLQDHTSIFVGQSGVGKSSLIKTLLPDEEIRIGELSEAASKGRHTTTHSQLFHFPFGGLCIDSPGIREFGLWHATPSDVLNGFPEIEAVAGSCKFRDCAHSSEPGCAIIAAIADGTVLQQRFDSYSLILNQLDDVTIKTQSGLKKR